jgi:hypothetical protein
LTFLPFLSLVMIFFLAASPSLARLPSDADLRQQENSLRRSTLLPTQVQSSIPLCVSAARFATSKTDDWIRACSNCHSGSMAAEDALATCQSMTGSWCQAKACRPEGCAETPACATARTGDYARTTTANVPFPPSRPANLGAARPNATSPASRTSGDAQGEQATPTGNASADQSRCNDLAQRAAQCCNNPSSCITDNGMPSGPAPGQGLNEYCQQMRAMGAMGGQANESAGAVCYRSYDHCVRTCDNLAAGYSGQEANSLRQTAQACRRYESRVVALGNQGLGSQSSGSSGDICNNVSQAAPQNMGGSGSNSNSANNASPNSNGNPNDPYGCATDPSSAACQQCSTNPNTPACRALAYEKEVRGEATFGNTDSQEKEKSPGSDFNIQDSPSDGSGLGLTAGAVEPTAIKTGTVANNAGGGIPGGGGGSPASLGGGGGGRASPGSPGYTTDVLQGLSSPSGYSASAEPNQAGADGGFAGYGSNGRGPASDQNGVDLRRFLPGGDKDPMRRGVGGFNINSGQINGRFVNIWNRISDRMQEKCRLGELIGCER